jgi:hypothetical protein
MHKVEIELMDTLVYHAKCIVSNASRQKKSSSLKDLKCGCVRAVFDIVLYATGGRHSDGPSFLGPRFQVGTENPPFFFLSFYNKVQLVYTWVTHRGHPYDIENEIRTK